MSQGIVKYKRGYLGDCTLIKARTLSPAQRRTMCRVLRYYRNEVSRNKVTNVRYTLKRYPSSTAPWLEVFTRRTDCDLFSERQCFTEHEGSFRLGDRGALTITRATYGTTMDYTAHVARMLRAHWPAWAHPTRSKK